MSMDKGRDKLYIVLYTYLIQLFPTFENINVQKTIVYTLYTMVGVWPQQEKFTHSGHISSHLGFPSVRVVLSVTFVHGFVNGWRTVISSLHCSK